MTDYKTELRQIEAQMNRTLAVISGVAGLWIGAVLCVVFEVLR